MRMRPATVLPVLLALLAGNAGASEPLGNLSPDQALAAFETEPGFVVELVACEPQVVDPVALAFDEHGRLFVAEDRDYPVGTPDGRPQGVIALLEDLDHDGRMETRHDFATGIAFPNGVLCWRGGVVVTASPDVYWLSDTNGDGRADIRETWLTGFDTNATSQLRANDPTLGPDGWIHFAGGLRGGKVSRPGRNTEAVDTEKGDLRFRPDTGELELVTGKSQFGIAFDDTGNRFACMNRVQVQHAPLAARHLARNPHLPSPGTLQNCPEFVENTLMPQYSAGASRYFPISANVTTADSHEGTYSAACAVHLYRGNQLPTEYRGAAFSCDPTGNLVRGDRLEKTGGTFAALRIHEGTEALRSRDNWFRPVFLADGPDGALYVADMYRRTIEHPEYLPGEVRQHTDFESGKGMGRIWRLRGTTARKQRPTALARASSRRLVEELGSPIPWVRDTAFRLLLERGDPGVVDRLVRDLRRGSSSAVTLAAQLRLAAVLGGLTDETLRRALNHSDPAIRQIAVTLSEPRLPSTPALVETVLARADDPDPHVRFQTALSLGEIQDPRTLPALARIANRQAWDRWTRSAILSSLGHREQTAPFVAELARNPDPNEGVLILVAELGRLTALQAGQESPLAPVMQNQASAQASAGLAFQIAFLSGIAEVARDAARLAMPASTATTASLLEAARSRASNSQLSLPLRRQALRLLAFDRSIDTERVLKKLLVVSEPADIQTSAAHSLLLGGSADTAAELVTDSAWESHSPALRLTLIQTLAGRPELAAVLLDAIERGTLSTGLLTAPQKEALRKSKDAVLRSRAERLVSSVPGDRLQAFESAKASLQLSPHAQNGKTVFDRACASCHRFNQRGIPVGPDLFGIRQQPKETILYHIIIPEAEIAPNFVNYECELKDGRSLAGLLASESAASVTLRMAQGQEEILPRQHILRLSASRLSLMPQELEKSLALQDLADLLAYLRGER
ncbi:MAG: HEAT repeat domain-containing protein [Verrucomicrobiales bacterium]|nr:HEAT repeat domain-containing protein [Verrucomicrobiales bacterium]